MPILNLTRGQPQLTIIGRIRKGAPANGVIGRDLKHFRFTSDDHTIQDTFNTVYGDEPTIINCFVKDNTVSKAFQAFRELRTKTELKHRCDGESIWDYNDYGILAKTNTPCPCRNMNDYVDGKWNIQKCKPVGVLDVIIPELRRFGVARFTTTSQIDIVRIDAELAAIEQACGGLYGIPLQLIRRPEDVPAPHKNGGKMMVERWMVHIQLAPHYTEQLLSAMQATAPRLPQVAQYAALPEPVRVIDVDTGEILDEPASKAPRQPDQISHCKKCYQPVAWARVDGKSRPYTLTDGNIRTDTMHKCNPLVMRLLNLLGNPKIDTTVFYAEYDLDPMQFWEMPDDGLKTFIGYAVERLNAKPPKPTTTITIDDDSDDDDIPF